MENKTKMKQKTQDIKISSEEREMKKKRKKR